MFRFNRLPDGNFAAKTDLRALQVYREPLLSKGSAFTADERRRLRVDCLLPAYVSTIEEQVARATKLIERLDDPYEKFQELAQLRDRNEHLFYRVLKDRLVELMPIVYTPTVAAAVRLFSKTFRRAHGVWITPDHRGHIEDSLRDAVGGRIIRLVVLTDNESILGIGDQGAGGIEIANGKVALYCACAGVHPGEALGISFDVGTNNEELLNDPMYLGWRGRRLRGSEYMSLLDEAVEAIRKVAPEAIVQWEDFRNVTAVEVLNRYRDVLPSFNDDIQGTGAIAVAGIRVGCRAAGVDLAEQRFIVFGGGAAGYGIAVQIRGALEEAGMSAQDAMLRVATLDSQGLLVEGRSFASAPYKAELALPKAFAAGLGLEGGAGLQEVVDKFKATVLVGTCGQPGTFTREVVESMGRNAKRPIILPLSNPNDLCEAAPADILAWSDGRALVATGSPNPPVKIGDRSWIIGQGNNAFIFPALGLAAVILRPKRIDDDWMATASHAAAESVTDEEIRQGLLYPAISRLPEVVAHITAALVDRVEKQGMAAALERVKLAAWEPIYPEFV